MSAPDKIWLEPDHAREFSGEPDEINAEFFQCYVPIALIAEAVARERAACITAIHDERLTDDTGDPHGEGYTDGLAAAISAIRARGQG
jgi:hypothetical protein